MIINLCSFYMKTNETLQQTKFSSLEEVCSVAPHSDRDQSSWTKRQLFSQTPDTTWIRFWAVVQQHEPFCLNYIRGRIVASFMETMGPINSTNQS